MKPKALPCNDCSDRNTTKCLNCGRFWKTMQRIDPDNFCGDKDTLPRSDLETKGKVRVSYLDAITPDSQGQPTTRAVDRVEYTPDLVADDDDHGQGYSKIDFDDYLGRETETKEGPGWDQSGEPVRKYKEEIERENRAVIDRYIEAYQAERPEGFLEILAKLPPEEGRVYKEYIHSPAASYGTIAKRLGKNRQTVIAQIKNAKRHIEQIISQQ